MGQNRTWALLLGLLLLATPAAASPPKIAGIDVAAAMEVAAQHPFAAAHGRHCDDSKRLSRPFDDFELHHAPADEPRARGLAYVFVVSLSGGKRRCYGEGETFVARLEGASPERLGSVPVRPLGDGLYVALARSMDPGARTLRISAVWRDNEGYRSKAPSDQPGQFFAHRSKCLWPRPAFTHTLDVEFLPAPAGSDPRQRRCEGSVMTPDGWVGGGEWVKQSQQWWWSPYDCHVPHFTPAELLRALDGLWVIMEGDSTLAELRHAMNEELKQVAKPVEGPHEGVLGVPVKRDRRRFINDSYALDGDQATLTFSFNGHPWVHGGLVGWASYSEQQFQDRTDPLWEHGPAARPDVYVLEGSLHDLHHIPPDAQLSGEEVEALVAAELDEALRLITARPGLPETVVLQTPPTQGGSVRGTKKQNTGVCGIANPSLQRPVARALIETVQQRLPSALLLDWNAASEPIFDSQWSDGGAHFPHQQIGRARVAILMSVIASSSSVDVN